MFLPTYEYQLLDRTFDPETVDQTVSDAKGEPVAAGSGVDACCEVDRVEQPTRQADLMYSLLHARFKGEHVLCLSLA